MNKSYTIQDDDDRRNSSEFRARDFRAHLDSRDLGRINIGRVTATAKVGTEAESEPLLPVTGDAAHPQAVVPALVSETPSPPMLKHSITKAIKREIKTRTRQRNTGSLSGSVGTDKEKAESDVESAAASLSVPLVGDSDAAVDAIVDAVMKKLQKRMTKELDGMAKALRKQLNQSRSPF